ncbi:ABC transporter substrate-binding protein [Cryobacterium sp. TMT1-3]|uniref:ABC transporter substrate-binding protein n=1 Tax=Cryobacterium luteum TaxID=1424661 RepID=A0A1H8GQ19_9MICO|nr:MULTISPECIES: ABC transporter substrate-binding protein [Cryobacterium]TFB84634.1 ABC transporter substrate-binding protein [Cryobacterium luteum]TFC28416.1 ABC transporter substrate-binding protein [Cryobacterium sp. TMT1-3]SEN45930.1 ABC-type nitrate/sulfonate/bicarbonate transport system, substrate-binding protein [Cryobacterium luteum]
MTPSRGLFSRRSATRVVRGVAIAAVLTLSLAACAGSDTEEAGANEAASFGDASVQFSWIKNAEFMGEYLADENGYFTEAGFDSVDMIEGPASIEAAVISGNVDMGIGNAISTGTIIANEGAPLKIIGATYQKNPFTILSLADKGNIAALDDLKGKTIGVQASNLSLWEAFLEINDIDEDSLTTLPVQYDPTPLFNGEVDGWFSYLTNESIDAELLGLDPVNLPLADFGLPFVAETLTVTDDAIENDRDKLKALLVAEIRGWTDAINDPEAAAKLTVDTYGPTFDLTIEKETRQAEIQSVDLVVSADTLANGLFSISSELQQQSIDTLAATGLTITASQLFDMTLLDEVYAENPDLLAYSK